MIGGGNPVIEHFVFKRTGKVGVEAVVSILVKALAPLPVQRLQLRMAEIGAGHTVGPGAVQTEIVRVPAVAAVPVKAANQRARQPQPLVSAQAGELVLPVVGRHAVDVDENVGQHTPVDAAESLTVGVDLAVLKVHGVQVTAKRWGVAAVVGPAGMLTAQLVEQCRAVGVFHGNQGQNHLVGQRAGLRPAGQRLNELRQRIGCRDLVGMVPSANEQRRPAQQAFDS